MANKEQKNKSDKKVPKRTKEEKRKDKRAKKGK